MSIAAQISRQVEFYFSDANLRRDKFMRQKLQEHSDGFVPIDVLLTFSRLKALASEGAVVADSIASESKTLKLNADRTGIARIAAFVDALVSSAHVKACTAYLNRIPADATIESMNKFLSQFGTVSLVRIPKPKTESELSNRGFAFVEFTTPDAVAKLVAAIPRVVASLEPVQEQEPGQEGVATEPEAMNEKIVKPDAGEEQEVDDSVAAEPKPKPMYALTLAEWKEWTKIKRNGKAKAAAAAEEPNKVGHLVRVTGNLAGATVNDIKSIFNKLGDAKFVDFFPDATYATIRFATAEIAKEVTEKVAEGNVKFGENLLNASILTEEESKQYWENVQAQIASRSVQATGKRSFRRQGKKNHKRTRDPAADTRKGSRSSSPKKAKTEEGMPVKAEEDAAAA